MFQYYCESTIEFRYMSNKYRGIYHSFRLDSLYSKRIREKKTQIEIFGLIVCVGGNLHCLRLLQLETEYETETERVRGENVATRRKDKTAPRGMQHVHTTQWQLWLFQVALSLALSERAHKCT